LREITINHSNLQTLRFDYSLPPSLQILNLRYNNISDIDFTLFKPNPNLKINLSYNKLNNELIDTILTVNPKADIKMQNRFDFIYYFFKKK
jgi:Leucine-rich repeat (LRR) protein